MHFNTNNKKKKVLHFENGFLGPTHISMAPKTIYQNNVSYAWLENWSLPFKSYRVSNKQTNYKIVDLKLKLADTELRKKINFVNFT